jgi:ferrous iron transport protein B
MKTLGLIGLPNSGKSALFNALTGSNQRVANFPGITVEEKRGQFQIENHAFEILDLPGVYSLDPYTLDEKVTRDFITNKKNEKIDVFILVIDATNLSKSLFLAHELKTFKIPFVIALNLFDEAQKRGLKLDIKKLEEIFETSVSSTVAIDKKGIEHLKESILKAGFTSSHQLVNLENIQNHEFIEEHFKHVDQTLDEIVLQPISADTLTEKLDRIFLHPILGIISIFLVLIFTFQLLFTWAAPFQDFIDSGIGYISDVITQNMTPGLFQSFMIDGIIAGFGAVIVFLPHIFLLFLFILFLEDSGYMGRIAFMTDYFMRKMGLPGKAIVPLISSHACAIPGIMAARIIENPTQRLLTIMIAPLMSCSARLPVYTMIIGAIAPIHLKWMGISISAWLMFSMYFLGIIFALLIAFSTKKLTRSGNINYLLMELPSYRVPRLKNLFIGAFSKAKVFITKAGLVIFTLTIVIWFLVTFPQAPENSTEPAINYSAAANIGKKLEPVFQPLGFDWKITTALIPSFAAREVMVSSLATVLSVSSDSEEDLNDSLVEIIANEYSLATLLSLLVWFVFSPQCISTLGILKRETGGSKYPWIFLLSTIILAYLMSFITFHLFS